MLYTAHGNNFQIVFIAAGFKDRKPSDANCAISVSMHQKLLAIITHYAPKKRPNRIIAETI